MKRLLHVLMCLTFFLTWGAPLSAAEKPEGLKSVEAKGEAEGKATKTEGKATRAEEGASKTIGEALETGKTDSAERQRDLEEEMDALRRDMDALREQLELERTERQQEPTIIHPGFERLKISGEIRLREEYKRHIYTPSDSDGDERFDFLHMRTRLRFDVDVVEDVAAVIELQDVRFLGDSGDTFDSTIYDDEGVDLKRGEIVLSNLLVEHLTAEAGRFVMFYGDQRLIGHLEWLDQGRTYDGARLSYKPGGWYTDVFAFRFNDEANSDQDDRDCIGVYAGREEVLPNVGLEGYAMLYRDQVRNPPTPLHDDERRFTTLGTRAFGGQQGFDYTGEFAYQTGDVGSDDLSAYAFAVKGGYTFEDAGWTPRIGLEVDYASGDRRPGDGDSERFQTLFPTNHLHYGYADLVGWSNMWDFRGGFSLKPLEDVTVTADWHHFLLADSDDAWINAGGGAVRPGQDGASRHLGEELDIVIKWKPVKPLDLEAGWAHFFPGGFVEDTGRDRQADFVYFQTRLVF